METVTHKVEIIFKIDDEDMEEMPMVLGLYGNKYPTIVDNFIAKESDNISRYVTTNTKMTRI